MEGIPEFDFSKPLKGVRVLLRASLNAPLERGAVSNDFRLDASLKTIEALALSGARVVVVGHLGRERTASLRVVYEVLKKRSQVPLHFVDDVAGARAKEAAEALKDGTALVVENVRREKGETENDSALAQRLATLGDVYINDAFPDSHRPHASIVGVPKFLPHFAGPNFMKEVRALEPARSPESPSLALIGGAKFATKEPLLRVLLQRYDRVFVGGALANDFLKAKGFGVGRSLVSGAVPPEEWLISGKLLLPIDVVAHSPAGSVPKPSSEVLPNESILDIGPETCAMLEPLIVAARFILWNGPMGNFEEGFSEGTETIGRMVAQSSATSVVGGGDTLAAIERLNASKQFTYLSGAGGAMLDYVANGTLPGIEALER